MRVMYVEDCPHCGCAVVQEDSAVVPPALLAADTCSDSGCSCHRLLRRELASAS